MTGDEIELIWKIAGVVFAAGAIFAELKAIRRDIARLEKKQDKYNNLQERTLKLETWSEMHEKECLCLNSERKA